MPKEKVVERGDTISTAGRRFGRLGSLFPQGIPIGSVKHVSQTDIENFQQVQVDPFVDFSSLDTLVVLVPKENRAADAVTADSSRRRSSFFVAVVVQATIVSLGRRSSAERPISSS